jgi:hypothetical protein
LGEFNLEGLMMENKFSAPDKNMKPDEYTQSFSNLLGITLSAINLWPPMYVSSIFGKPLQWLPIHRYSEYTLLNLWRLPRTVKYLLDVSIPTLPFNPPVLSPPFLGAFFFRPTKVLHRPDHNQNYTTFPSEAWFFINGIMTNDSVAQLNAAYISDLFHRPVTIIQNTTQSLLVDLTECALGKIWENEWRDIQEAAAKAFPPIYDALKSQGKNKVVVIAHSQGTIIMSVVLAMLKQLTRAEPFSPAAAPAIGPLPMAAAAPEEIFPYEGILDPADFALLSDSELSKLEIYCFANCANRMTYLMNTGAEDRPIPWIENYGNEYDIVARLGMLAPGDSARKIRIDGPIFMKPNAWGHMLNEHYLKEIDQAQRVRLKRGGHGKTPAAPYRQLVPDAEIQPITPRLYAYINGGSPVS